MNKRTKIVATVGPSTNSKEIIENMIKQGEGKRVDSKLARGSDKNADISLPFHPNIVKMIISI